MLIYIGLIKHIGQQFVNVTGCDLSRMTPT